MNELGQWVALGVLAVAAVTDIRHLRVENRLTYPAMLAGLMLAATTSFPGSSATGADLMDSLSGLFGCGLLMLMPYWLSGGGAGDVKLAAAIGSLLGFQPTLQGFCLGYIVAAVYVSVLACPRWLSQLVVLGPHLLVDQQVGPLPTDRNGAGSTTSGGRQAIPLAGFFLVGTLCVTFAGPLW